MSEKFYTQEQLDIALLKNTNEGILETLKRFDIRFDELEQKIESNFHWTLGLMVGIYAISISGLLSVIGKAYGWF